MAKESSSTKGFTSSLGVIMASVGSAVGLGNIWRFPYICGQYGGGAFLVVYLFFVFFIGMMLMMTEFVIGRRAQHTPIKAFETLAPNHLGWKWLGQLGLITCFLIISLYVVVSGWTCSYFWNSSNGVLSSLGVDIQRIKNHFDLYVASPVRPINGLIAFGVLVAVVIVCGVQKGIEKVSKVLMPILFLLLIVMCVKSVSLENSSVGLRYLFFPDFSKLTGEGVLAALGQALFSLSVGMGVMLVYGSYIPKEDNIFKSAMWITVCDTLIAICAGVAIFPAVFSMGFQPQEGPELVFKVLLAVFNSMGSVGGVFASLFFLLLLVAALTSAISLLEALVASNVEYTHIPRPLSTVVFTIMVLALGSVLSLSNGIWSDVTIGGKNLFGFVDSLNSIYLPPVCALLTIIFLGWVMPQDDIRDELSNHGTLKIGYYPVYMFVVRYVAPVALLVVLISGILL